MHAVGSVAPPGQLGRAVSHPHLALPTPSVSAEQLSDGKGVCTWWVADLGGSHGIWVVLSLEPGKGS